MTAPARPRKYWLAVVPVRGASGTIIGYRCPEPGCEFQSTRDEVRRRDPNNPKMRYPLTYLTAARADVHDHWLAVHRRCRVCSCTESNCRGCIERTGIPCHWVGPDLCSACKGGGQ